jgi:2-methylcitrate dehydratase PrpD
VSGGFTAELAAYVAAGSVDALPPHAVEAAGQLFLDTTGVMLAGAIEPVSRTVRAVVRTEGGQPRALVIGTRLRTSVTGAALANGTSAHALDLDDSHHPGFLHPSAVLVPAVLALGEARGASGAEAIAAYLYGLETLTAVGSAINLRHYELGWHATATIGTLAAAAAAAKLLRLDVERTRVALSLAASEAAGVRRNFGSMAKPLHAGLASRAGVLAALLAEEGLTAGEAVLEGERGFFDLVAGPGEWDADAGLTVLDGGFALAIDGLGIKRYASCGVTHAPIEAALALGNGGGLAPERIASVELVVNPLARQIAVYDDPADGLQSKFSLPHCVAVALLDGRADLAQFTDERACDPRVVELRRRTRVTTDPAVGLAGHMSFGCRLAATLDDGSVEQVAVEMARGKWAGERLTQDEVVAKFRSCAAAGGVDPDRAEACRALIERLVELEDIAVFAAALHDAAVA